MTVSRALCTAVLPLQRHVAFGGARAFPVAARGLAHTIKKSYRVPPSSEKTPYENLFDQADTPSRFIEELKYRKTHQDVTPTNYLGEIVQTSRDPHYQTPNSERLETSVFTENTEPTLPRKPDLEKGELASGATVTRTNVWHSDHEPAIVSVGRFQPSCFRPAGFVENVICPDTCNPEGIPDFRDSRLEPGHADRRGVVYLFTAASWLITAAGVRAIICKAVHSLWLSRANLAAGVVEVDISKVEEGKQMVVKWRGKPVFVKKRNSEQIRLAREGDARVNDLKDPQLDTERCPRPEWLICMGVCTHLGCVPLDNAGDYNGYFCPCHGSHYDTSGRIRRGPAPSNLEIPEHKFVDDTTILLG